MNIRFQFWIERNGEIVLDKRLAELLKAANEFQSLSAATRKYRMSYRQAWGKLRAAEGRLGFKLLDCPNPGKGMCLTPNAIRLLEKYDILQHNMVTLFREESNKIFYEKGEEDKPEKLKKADSVATENHRVTIVGSSKNKIFRSREIRSYAAALYI